jgi:cysteine-rich repeat protein
MKQRVIYGAPLGVVLAVTTLLAARAGASSIAQNSSWRVTRPGATTSYRIVAYGDSIFAGYTGVTTVCRRAAPLVAGEYCAALSGQNFYVYRRCQSGAVASGVYSRITGDRSYMQDASTRIVTFEMCGNDYLQARSSFKSQSGTCDYSGLNTAASNCYNYLQQAMQYINANANANTRVKIVSNLYYPGYDADNTLSSCNDPVTGTKVNMRTMFLPRLLESNWWTCKYAEQYGFQCGDAFAEYMAPDYDSNGDGLIDSDAIRYVKGESLASYKARVLALASTLRDANGKAVTSTTTYDYIQSDDTHPNYEGPTASTFLTTPSGDVSVYFSTSGAYPDGKNPHWNQNGHDRMGWGLDPTCTYTPPLCGNGVIDTTWLPSGTPSPEGCDDGNTADGDGCSSSCTVETGYACSGAPSMCAPVCGDGLVVGGEQCDDGDTEPGDGCSATCTVEPGWSCMGYPSTCTTICGDGLVVDGEGCDDGNLNDGDGCSSSCTVEEGWSCSGETSVCAPICGDGLIRGTEECDDNDDNGTPQSCCSASCTYRPEGTACEDGDACTSNACDGQNNCIASPVNCDDNDPCTDDSCDPSTGCIYTNNTAPCDDGNACTTNDTCSDDVCVGGPPPNCDDGNVCTDDSCDPAIGCVNTNNTLPCNDGNACTTADTCSDGVCVGGPPPNCDDGNLCTDDSCDPAIGCVNTNNTAPCDDDNACTQTDVCSGGGCVGTNYSWSGVLQPINSDGSSIFKLGSTIPVKFKLTGACAANPSLVAHIMIAKVSDSIVGTYQEATSTSAADTGNTFRYSATDDQYIYNLATKPLSAGTWQIAIDLGDGSGYRLVLISLKP